MTDDNKIVERIRALTGWAFKEKVIIVKDTTQWMNIQRGQIIDIGGKHYLVKGNEREARFGIEDQPKYWVFNALELETGEPRVIKTVFNEEFIVRIGLFRIRCYRSSRKEARVLELVEGDTRFMQGITRTDEKGNPIRILDRIKGTTLLSTIVSMNKDHETYFHEDLPGILRGLKDCFEGILFLHENNTCHGDIRNDHIYVENDTGKYRWIDFDLTQDAPDFDIWSIGNILCCAVAKGISSFHGVLKSDAFTDQVKKSLVPEDGSAFYEYRVMNLKKLYPYIPERLSNLLLHFTIKPIAFYNNISKFIDEYNEMLDSEFPQR